MLRRLFLKALALLPLGAVRTAAADSPCLKPPSGMDARDWAASWLEHVRLNPSIATDEGCMIAWFANAIMAGYDAAELKFNPQDAEWFMYDPEGEMDCGMKSEQEALQAARDIIDICRDEETWPESIMNGIRVGRIVHTSRQDKLVTKEMLDENGYYDGKYYGDRHDYYCEYVIG